MNKPKTPIVVEVYDDGYIKVHANDQRPDVSVVVVNRPYSEHDDTDADVAEAIDRVVAARLPYPHRQAYTAGWVIKTHLKERWDAERLARVRANTREIQLIDMATQ